MRITICDDEGEVLELFRVTEPADIAGSNDVERARTLRTCIEDYFDTEDCD